MFRNRIKSEIFGDRFTKLLLRIDVKLSILHVVCLNDNRGILDFFDKRNEFWFEFLVMKNDSKIQATSRTSKSVWRYSQETPRSNSSRRTSEAGFEGSIRDAISFFNWTHSSSFGANNSKLSSSRASESKKRRGRVNTPSPRHDRPPSSRGRLSLQDLEECEPIGEKNRAGVRHAPHDCNFGGHLWRWRVHIHQV